jgi:hypothetical protein|nr:MAG TPA: hypothetical protein [Caudoviricetes sp.]
MNKFKFIIVRVWFIILFVAIFIGVNRILSFDKYGFLSLIFTIGSVIITLYLFSRENEEKTEKILKNAKIIYSLNYTNLKNIKGIELTAKREYFVILNKSGNDFKIKLNNKYIPESQEMLIKLDEMYNR